MLCDTISIKGQSFPALVAITENEQRQGLMWKPYPTPIMIFPYSTASIHKFWMHNTIAPLDIIFCKDNIILSIAQGEPLSTKLVGPNEPTDCVVELPGGSAQLIGLKPGDYIGYMPKKEVLAGWIAK
jgi:hypothetical protein